MHFHLLLLGEAFTNDTWSKTNNFQFDKQFGKIKYGTVVYDFARIPVQCITIAAILEYFVQHGVAIEKVPWDWREQKSPSQLELLDPSTRPAYCVWVTMLSLLLANLHTALVKKNSAYKAMRHKQNQPQPSLHPVDAVEFLCHQFPEECGALAENTRRTTAVSLLLLAKEFATEKKYKGRSIWNVPNSGPSFYII